ncbi:MULTISPECIES: hypothetical protein [unclassified Nocardioides]|uniref:hypothetical protein n=1 Tax=unclassified Nocardioides TaxID=2615069 RepID=UPI0009EFD348|nr:MULTISPECIES: hypothetical protein [unclassified Nocardioides]GAW51484.1 hypothetical protein PD653B2_3827 [Nocardioides sp. PD653-B2]GAW54082.1 hypothetical protein PD653_1489 [Nocardioides sp. PD653]
MSDLTPPPDEPMPERTRARIRADLLAATRDGEPSRAQRWLLPGVAAAAVVLVVGLAAWAVQVGGDDDSAGTPVASTSTSTSGAPTGATPSETPSRAPSAKTTGNQDGGDEAGTNPCVDELADVLPGADPEAAFPEADGGTTTFWVKGDRFVLCDVRAGTTTVHKPLPMTPVEQVETYRVSSIFAPANGGGFRAIRVAGGLVPEGFMAYDVSYTFPDGHTEQATTTMDPHGRTWWRMVYAYVDDGGNEMEQTPIHVVVRYSGVQRSYDLQWGIDTCAQANHGC